MGSESEVAALIAAIDREYEAAQQGLTGLALGDTRHEFILKRQETIATLHGRLQHLVDEKTMAKITLQMGEGKAAQ